MSIEQVTMFLPVDKTGTNINNLIENELHTVQELEKIIKPNMTAFYSNGLIVKKIVDNDETILVRGTDYILTDLFTELTVDTGKEIFGSITFITSIINSTIDITYQAYGGDKFGNNYTIAAFIPDYINSRITNWNTNVAAKPLFYPPKLNHQHDWKDIYGADLLVDMIERITDGITKSKSIYELGINNRLTTFFSENQIDLDSFYTNIINNKQIAYDINNINAQNKFMIDFIRQYNIFDFNKEVSLIIDFILQDKYSISSAYNDLYNVINNVPGLDLWIDFSDTTKVTKDGSNRIGSVTDKSTNARVFSQTDNLKKPLSFTNINNGLNDISKNTSAKFTSESILNLTTGSDVTIGDKFTLIVLTRTNGEANILGNSSNTNKFILRDASNRILNLSTNKYNIKSNAIGNVGNGLLVNFLSVGLIENSIPWNVGNITNAATNKFGLSEFSNTKSILNSVFNFIGNTNTSLTTDYDVSEIILFNRQLSLIEVEVIKNYLSRKWAGTGNLTSNLVLDNVNTINQTTQVFWQYL